MKVAVEISGFMRGFHDCIHSWKNFLEPTHTYDFFISTYDIYGYNHTTQWDCDPDYKVDFDRVKEEIEEYGSLCELRTQMPTDEPRYKQMFERIQEAHELCKSWADDYSYFIRIRPDIFMSDKVSLIVPEPEVSIFPEFWGFCEEPTIESCRWQGGQGLCDQMAVCGSKAMQVYSDTAKNPLVHEIPENCILDSFQKEGKNPKWLHQDFGQCVLSRNKP